MSNYNTKNEIIKKHYEEYLTLNQGLSDKTIYEKISHLRKYETFTGFKCFSTFNKRQGLEFKEAFKKSKNHTGGKMAYATIWRTLKNLKEFFEWLSRQPNYKSKVNYDDARCFNLSRKEENIAKRNPYRTFPSIEHVKEVIHSMPTETEIKKRNQALMAFALLTGARVQAIVSLKLGDVDEIDGVIAQDPEHVNTKFSKYIVTTFFPVGADIEEIAVNWVKYLRQKKGVDLNHPLFPAVKNTFNDETKGFEQTILSDEHIKSTTTVHTVFKEAYENAGLPYYSPHTLRHTITALGQKVCKTPEEFKAWSQNLGHTSPLTTFNSYGEVAPNRQCEIIKKLGETI